MTNPAITPPAAPVHHRSRRQDMIVGTLIALTVIAVVGMLAIIAYRWMSVVEPTTGIMVQGAAEHDGTDITVTDGTKTYDVELNRTNDYLVYVCLTPGTYTMTAAQQGHPVLRQQFTVAAYRGLSFVLPHLPKPATQPAASVDAR